MSKSTIKVQFPGSHGLTLAARLDLPSRKPTAYALFAHCFTCSKDSKAASYISSSLAAAGIAVLRFDFTGLGGSDGDFANSNFSSNVNDLKLAADFLRENYRAPSLLIGHSLGGAAVLAAAHAMEEVKGLVTIGAPADPANVVKQFGCNIDEINREGVAEVQLAGRPFTIKKQFLDDLTDQNQAEKIAKLKKALLVFHSPMDETVSIHEAEKIYRNAKHPKSFISLDNADHLLTKARDAEYVAVAIAAWATRYVDEPENIEQKTSAVSKGEFAWCGSSILTFPLTSTTTKMNGFFLNIFYLTG